MKPLDSLLIESVLAKARASERKRVIHCFHDPAERVQRMINAGLHGTYIRPHKHENPDKLEVFMLLRGKIAVFAFNDDGSVKDKLVLQALGPNHAVEIPPRTWHTFIVVSDEAVVYEIIDGMYDPKTHKKMAVWAPEEGTSEAVEFLAKLESLV